MPQLAASSSSLHRQSQRPLLVTNSRTTTTLCRSSRRCHAVAMSDAEEGKQKTVLIAGAGVIGSSIAYHLALKGLKATLYDQVGPGCAASGKAGGFLGRGRFLFVPIFRYEPPRCSFSKSFIVS